MHDVTICVPDQDVQVVIIRELADGMEELKGVLKETLVDFWKSRLKSRQSILALSITGWHQRSNWGPLVSQLLESDGSRCQRRPEQP